MIFGGKVTSREAVGLRTRYYPRNRIGQGLISVAPYFDIVLLILCFVILQGKCVVQPGTVIELPKGDFLNGSPSGLEVRVQSLRSGGKDSRKEIIYFDDERFIVARKEQMESLRKNIIKNAKEHPEKDLIIYADDRVKYGTVQQLHDMAIEAGIDRVNDATSPK